MAFLGGNDAELIADSFGQGKTGWSAYFKYATPSPTRSELLGLCGSYILVVRLVKAQLFRFLFPTLTVRRVWVTLTSQKKSPFRTDLPFAMRHVALLLNFVSRASNLFTQFCVRISVSAPM